MLADFETANEKEKMAETYSDSDAFNSNLAERNLKKKHPIVNGTDEVKALIPAAKKQKPNVSRMNF